MGPTEFTTKTETDRSSKRLTGSVDSMPCHLTDGVGTDDFADEETCEERPTEAEKEVQRNL